MACAGWPLRARNAAGGYGGLTQPHTIEEAYAECRTIARREAKNFYYAFVALPAQKRDAMCAIYAFMRHADDISDDESKDRATRRDELARWTAAWRDATDTTDPVFIAVRDTQQRFDIPDELLEQLIHGTAMDIQADDVRSRSSRWTQHLRDIRRSISVLLLRCVRRGTGVHTDIRLQQPGCRETC